MSTLRLLRRRLILLHWRGVAHSVLLLLQPARNLISLHRQLRQALLCFSLGINVALFAGFFDDLAQLHLLRVQAGLGFAQAAVVGVHQLLLQVLRLILQALGVLHGSLLAALGLAHLGGQLGNALLHCFVDRAQLIRLGCGLFLLRNLALRRLDLAFFLVAVSVVVKRHGGGFFVRSQIEFQLFVVHLICHDLPYR